MAWWLTPRTPDPEVGVRASLGSPCCALEQEKKTKAKLNTCFRMPLTIAKILRWHCVHVHKQLFWGVSLKVSLLNVLEINSY